MLDLPADHVEARVALTLKGFTPEVSVIAVRVDRVDVAREKATVDGMEDFVLVSLHSLTLYPTGQ